MGYIKGITIEIDGETKGLDAALKKVNSSTKSLQSELKRVDQLLKLNPTNTDLVKQKQALLANQISETKTKLEALKQAQDKLKADGLDETNADYRRLQREIEETNNKLKSLTYQQAEFAVSGSRLGQVTAKMALIGEKATEVGNKLKGLSTAASLIGIAAAKTTSDFDSAMSQVMAISGATGDEFTALRDKAREMGENTKFSAEESAEAMTYMAMAGWKTEDMLQGIEGVMYLAAASGEDLATTSDIVTDALTAMGYAAGDSGRLADVMAAASANANTNVSMMGETFKYAATVAGTLHYSMEDVALATGLMANAGVKSTQAGTSLRSIMSRMAAPTSEVASAMEQLGVSLTNTDGTTKSFRQVMQDLRTSMADLSDTEKTQIANSIAGKNSMSGFLAIINASDEDFNQLAEAIDNADGSAEDMANTMLDNLGGQLTILKSALQELGIAIGDTLVPMVKKCVTVVQAIVDWFNGLNDGTKAVIAKILVFVAALAPMLLIFGKLTAGINGAVLGFAKLYANIVTGQGVIGVLVKTVFPAVISGLKAIFTLMLNNPISIVITVIGLLVVAFITLWKKSESFRNFWINLWSKIKAAVSSAVNGIKTVFSAVYNHLVSPVKRAWNGIKSVFSGIKSWFQSVGSNVASGIWSGLSGKLSWIKNQIKSWVGNVKAFMKKLFGIKSPSRWARDIIGSNLAAGIGVGFKSEMGSVNRSITDSLKNTMSVMSSPATLGFAGASNNTNTNITEADISAALLDALSGVSHTSVIQIDGRSFAETTAPLIETALNTRTSRANRKYGVR